MASSPGAAAQSKEVVFDLDAAAFSSNHFRMHEFKVKRCPRARPHDWTQCPFAHPGEKARRRDPRRYRYSGTACPEFRKSGCCRRGDACPFAHGVFECWLHPSRYRTQLCTDGTGCRRRVCFFAHSETELRRPEDDPVIAQCQAQAELAAEVQTLQQQHLTQTLSALLDANGQSAQGGTAGLAGNQLNMLALESLQNGGNTVAPNAGLQLALLQQLALVEQVQKQQAQQLLNGLSCQGGAVQASDPKGLPSLLSAVNQETIQQLLKNQLAEQLKTSNPALDALSLLASGAIGGGSGDAQIDNHQAGQIPVSTAIESVNGAVGNIGLAGAQTPEAAAVSASVVANGPVQKIELPGRGLDQNGSLQVPLLQTNGLAEALDPGQLAALRAHAAIGGRRSIDNGVLARSVSDLMGALDASEHGSQTALMASLGGDTVNGQVNPLGYSVATSVAPCVQNLDTNGTNTSWSNKEALKQAKNLLENLSLLQGGKNGSSGNGLLTGVNMETLLTANGMSTMNRVTSFDKILEELPKNMSEVRAQEGAHVFHRATSMAGGDRL